ncbi:MAG: hypothetical protein COA82_11825 [Alkaliphilus sp.]|nr:MAG: hypothetical protein COA82_11825 [Alkaliphilus sp.]
MWLLGKLQPDFKTIADFRKENKKPLKKVFRDFYGDKFKYDKQRDLYICPAGKELCRMNHRKENPVKVRYRNYDVCKECEYKERCTKSKKGREINRSKHQDFLDIFDARTKENQVS